MNTSSMSEEVIATSQIIGKMSLKEIRKTLRAVREGGPVTDARKKDALVFADRVRMEIDVSS